VSAHTAKAWFDLHWLDTVRPSVRWLVTTEKLLIVLQQLAPSERDRRWHRHERWGTRTPSALLSGTSSYGIGVEPIRSVEDLERRFRYIVLERCGPAEVDPVQAWREHHKIALDGRRRFRVAHGSIGWDAAIRSYLNFDAPQLRVSLNYIHRGAREFQGAHIAISRDGLAIFRVWFGLDGSRWEHELTRQRAGEPVGASAVRALAMLRAVTGRDNAPFVGELYGADAPFVVYVDEQGPLTSDHRCYGDGWRALSAHAIRAEADDAAMKQIAREVTP
jgi:hypothetical protein